MGGALIATAGLTVVTAPAAHAVAGKKLSITATCLGFFINTDPALPIGSTGAFVPPGTPFPLPIDVQGVGGPTEVDAGSSFKGTAGTISVHIPNLVDTKIKGNGIGINGDGVVRVHAAANIIETVQVQGAASIGTPKIVSNGAVVGPTVPKVGSNEVKIKYPGTKTTDSANFRLPPANTDVVTGDEHQFNVNSNFNSPTLQIPVTAGKAGTKIKFKLISSIDPHASSFGNFTVDSDVDAFDTGDHIFVRAFCDANALTLGSVSVVAPPPPGAPNAVADVAQTDEGKAVDIDVLANDTANPALAIDKDSLAITANPDHGSAKVNADHTVTYTPAAGFSGTDTFSYKLCSVPEPATTTTSTTTTEPTEVIKSVSKATAAQHCDTADVTVTVLAPQVIAQAPSTTPTTVAAAAELPKTGSSDTPLVFIGLGLVAGGLAVAGIARSRRKYSLQ